MNKENIKKAFDLFQDNKYIESKEILQKEIDNHRNSYFYNKLGLKESVINKSDDFKAV